MELDSRDSFSFRFTKRDAYGCTTLESFIFKKTLGLNAQKPVLVHRTDGKSYALDVLRCVSNGKTVYQFNLTDFGISEGSIVTFWPREEKNHIFLTAVEPSHVMWQNGGVVDAIVDLQKRLDELESELMY